MLPKNELVLKGFLGNFKCFKLMFFLGGSQNSKFSQFQIFPKLGLRGGGHQISNFSQIQKSPKHPGRGEGQENYGFFPYFGTFFNLKAPLSW